MQVLLLKQPTFPVASSTPQRDSARHVPADTHSEKTRESASQPAAYYMVTPIKIEEQIVLCITILIECYFSIFLGMLYSRLVASAALCVSTLTDAPKLLSEGPKTCRGNSPIYV